MTARNFAGRRFLLILCSSLAVLALVCRPAVASSTCTDVGDALNHAAEAGLIDEPTVQAFYDAAGPGCAWDDANAAALGNALGGAAAHGLDPTLFHASAGSDSDAAARDVLLTDGALKYAATISKGFGRKSVVDKDAAYSPGDRGNIEGLVQALTHHQVQAWIASFQPKTDTYARLQAALEMYRSIATHGGFELMSDDLAMKSRRKFRNYLALRERLVLEGDIPASNGSREYDDQLYQGIVHFQVRHGLRPSGRVTWKTLEQLNVSAGERVAQITLNLERLRQDEEPPATRIEVNLPAATAVLYRDGIATLTMNAVVGAPDHETPTLSSAIDTIIINPTWTIPESIVANEILPAMKRKRNYLRKNHMRWVGDQLVQDAGPFNSLGRIKFDFPNHYSVYLHDTPARRLFANPERAQSHGCVRLERPLDMAAALLEGSARWDRDALQAAIDRGKTRRIAVSNPMPVAIVYRTAFVADDGTVNFRPDIYNRDTKLTLGLSEAAVMQAQ